MPIEGLPQELAANEVLGGFNSMEELAGGYVDLAARNAPDRWKDSLPDDLKGDQSLTFKTVEELARGFVSTKSLVGRKRAMPAEDAPPAEWDEYYTDIGRPESPEKYELIAPADFPKEFYSPELEKGFRLKAHQEGLTGKQAKNIYDWYATESQAFIGQIIQGEKTAKEKAEKDLRAEWGDQYDAKVADADFLLQEFGGHDKRVAESLARKDPVWNHPALARMFAALGAAMRESDFIRGGDPEAKQTLEQERQKLMSSKAYFNKKDPDYASTQKRVKEIYTILNPDKGAEEE